MKRIITIIACIALTIGASAQQNTQQRTRQQGERREHPQGERRQFSPAEFKQRMEEFVTREAGLTAAEAQKFYPLLHEMMDKQRKNNDQARDLMHKCSDNSSDTQFAEAVNKSIELDLQNKKLEQEYYKKFHSVLSWKKVYKVKNALQRFNMEALRHFSPQGDGRGPRGDGQGPRGERRQQDQGGKNNATGAGRRTAEQK